MALVRKKILGTILVGISMAFLVGCSSGSNPGISCVDSTGKSLIKKSFAEKILNALHDQKKKHILKDTLNERFYNADSISWKAIKDAYEECEKFDMGEIVDNTGIKYNLNSKTCSVLERDYENDTKKYNRVKNYLMKNDGYDKHLKIVEVFRDTLDRDAKKVECHATVKGENMVTYKWVEVGEVKYTLQASVDGQTIEATLLDYSFK